MLKILMRLMNHQRVYQRSNGVLSLGALSSKRQEHQSLQFQGGHGCCAVGGCISSWHSADSISPLHSPC
eukprot:4610672-Prorocentrum_lima.AAC.2